jgi:hypothetical protein
MQALEMWLKGLVAALVGGGANAVTVAIVDPEHFNVHDGIDALLRVVVIGGLISVAGYLKTSPLPGLSVHRRREGHPGLKIPGTE